MLNWNWQNIIGEHLKVSISFGRCIRIKCSKVHFYRATREWRSIFLDGSIDAVSFPQMVTPLACIFIHFMVFCSSLFKKCIQSSVLKNYIFHSGTTNMPLNWNCLSNNLILTRVEKRGSGLSMDDLVVHFVHGVCAKSTRKKQKQTSPRCRGHLWLSQSFL